jgi:hypothetical protein
MRVLLLTAISFVALSGCANSLYEYEARQASAVGVDYPRAARGARRGNDAALITLFRVTPSLDGLGAEQHSGELQDLLRQYGDSHFAKLLRSQDPKIRQSVIDSLDFAFLVVTRDRHWYNSFPVTYSLGPHPGLRESQTRRPNHAMQPTASPRTASVLHD